MKIRNQLMNKFHQNKVQNIKDLCVCGIRRQVGLWINRDDVEGAPMLFEPALDNLSYESDNPEFRVKADVEAEVGAVAPQELGGREASEVTAVTAVQGPAACNHATYHAPRE